MRISRLRLRLVGAEPFFGREAELAKLDRAWQDRACGILELVAEGGAGKTSLAAEWRNRRIAEAREQDRGMEIFEWSFCSQGTRDHRGSPADPFFRAVLAFFGDVAMADSPAPQEAKGERIAELVEARGAVLILDGIEPLQRHDGELREPGVASLLRQLSCGCAGLCVVTTRVRVAELDGCSSQGVIRSELLRLDEESGSSLLKHLLEAGDRPRKVMSEAADRRAIWEEVQGHALTLLLTGSYIRHSLRDVRRWREIDFRRADDQVLGGHAFRVIDAYVRWLSEEEDTVRARAPGVSRVTLDRAIEGKKLLAVLRILGFFDRRADPGCVAKLREAPAVLGVTEAIVGLDRTGWEGLVSALEQMRLLQRCPCETVEYSGYDEGTAHAAGREGMPAGNPTPWSGRVVEGDAIEAHPLVREYFARVLPKDCAKGWREGHRRLFEHLCASVPYWPEGNEGLQPLYQAIVHGCAAGQAEQACLAVYRDRILRGERFYSSAQLGSLSSDLAALACFFESSWDRVSSAIGEADQGWVLGAAAYNLYTLGRVNDALVPMLAAHENSVEREEWINAAITADNLSECELTLGRIQAALLRASQAVAHAARSGDDFERAARLTTLANARHQAGEQGVRELFEEAESIQPDLPMLYSLQGHLYCDFLLHRAERAAWGRETNTKEELITQCSDVVDRVTLTLRWAIIAQLPVVDIALDHLTLGRAALYTALLQSDASPKTSVSGPGTVDVARHHRSLGRAVLHASFLRPFVPGPVDIARHHLDKALTTLRLAGQQHQLPRGLLTRAWLHHLDHEPTKAAQLLDEAERLATRGPMPLHLADVHLHRARLFHDRRALADARALIERHHYGRRLPELEDAERAASSWSAPTPTSQPDDPLMPVPQRNTHPVDIAIIIALPEEFRTLANDYADTWEARPSPDHSGSDFFFTGPNGYRCVAAISPGMGPTITAHISSCLLAYRAATLINVGIAGGFKDDLRIGDVIVPSLVEAYIETAKIDGKAERWTRRGAAYRPTSTLLAHVRELSFRGDSKAHFQGWTEAGKQQLQALDIEPDRQKIAEFVSEKVLRRTPVVETRYHIASGNFVVASKDFAEFIREANAEIVAGEMEAAGMMSTAEHRREPVATLVLRGISDHVDADKKRADAIGDGALRRLAMDNAWRLLHLLMELERLPRKQPPPPPRGPVPGHG